MQVDRMDAAFNFNAINKMFNANNLIMLSKSLSEFSLKKLCRKKLSYKKLVLQINISSIIKFWLTTATVINFIIV